MYWGVVFSHSFSYQPMEGLLISVIVPVYNVERYLAACLDSVLSQSYRNLEIIVINDGSTDFSREIAEKYSENDDRVRVYNFENEGLSEARNRGLRVATGEYITFVDSDDVLLPGALKKMVEALEQQQADIVQGMTVKQHSSLYIEDLKTPKLIEYSSQEAIEDVLYQKRLLPSACGKLYKKYLFDNFSFRKRFYYEDLDLFYKVFEIAKKIVFIEYPVYFYRDTEGSITHTWTPKRLDVLTVTEDIENYFRGKNESLLNSARDRRLSANFNMFALCAINGEKERASECWNIIKSYRRQSLFDKKVRLKNKAGILLSYFGRHIFNLAARRIYK